MKQKFMLCVLLLFIFIFQSCVTDPAETSSSHDISKATSQNSSGSTASQEQSQNENSADQSQIESQSNQTKDEWSGEYGFNMSDDVSRGDPSYSDYYLSIYKTDGKYFGHLVIEGTGLLNHDFYIYFEGDETKLDGYFKEGDPNKPYSSITEPGTKVFSLIKKDSKLYTVLHDYSMYYEGDSIEKGIEKIIFFKKDIQP